MADYDPALLDAAVEKIRAGARTISITWAADLQSRMRAGAPWNDRNGPSTTGRNARESLEAEAGALGDDIQIVARSDRTTPKAWRSFGNAPVAAFLELGTRYMAKRSIILPTLTAQAPNLKKQLSDMLKGDM